MTYWKYFDIFRREPAITEFDKPFTPICNSSQSFATLTGLVLVTGSQIGHSASGLMGMTLTFFQYAYL
jgi:hypothetical protein